MSENRGTEVEEAIEPLRAAESVSSLLGATARTLTEVLAADACTISRAIGDLLIDLADFSARGPVQLGHGYLISDFPLTRDVLESEESHTVWLEDPEVEPNEARLLRELGFDALLMLPMICGDERWGLVEIYAVGRGAFGADDAGLAERVVGETCRLLTELDRAR